VGCSCRSADVYYERLDFRNDAAVTGAIERRPQVFVLPFIKVVKDCSESDIGLAARGDGFCTLLSERGIYQFWDLLESTDPIV
jgi:hypothetical protein